MRLLHPLRADLASLRLLIGMHLTLVLRLHAIAVHLLASRHAVLRVGIAVLALEGLRLHSALPMLALRLHLETLRVRLALHREALGTHGVAATAAATSKHLRVSAATVSAAASEHLSMAAAVVSTTAAAAGKGLGVTAPSATAVVLGLLIAPAAAMRPRASRGCDRERGDAGCEKHPGHDKISFRTAKTARSLHRSNR
jgi:hypothetical protein